MSGTIIEVPSGHLRGTPPFRCLLPEGWTAAETPGACISMQPLADPSVSLLVNVSRVASDTDLRDVVVRSFARQRGQHPELRLDAQRVGRFGDRVTYVRAVTVPVDPELAQVHAMFLGGRETGRPVVDAFTIVGSCPTGAVEAYCPVFIDVIASFESP